MGVSRRDFLLLSGAATIAPALAVSGAAPEASFTWFRDIALVTGMRDNFAMHQRVMRSLGQSPLFTNGEAFKNAMAATRVHSVGRPVIAIDNVAAAVRGAYQTQESGLSKYVTGVPPHVA